MITNKCSTAQGNGAGNSKALLYSNSSKNPDLLGLLEPTNYITGESAQIKQNLILYASHQRRGDNYHDWLCYEKKGSTNKKGEKSYVFYRGKIGEDGIWRGHRTRKLAGGRKDVGQPLTGSDIREISKKRANGILFIPAHPFHLPFADNCRPSNNLFGEWDTKDPNPNNWLWVKVLNCFAQKGFTPNTITSSGGKCNGLSPHTEWIFSEVLEPQTHAYFRHVLICLGADPNVLNKRMSQFRAAGYYRHSKGKEQGLHVSHHANFCDGREWLAAALEIGKELGIDIPTPEQWHKEQLEAAERLANLTPIDLSQFEGSDIEKLLIDIDSQCYPYTPGGNTYLTRFVLYGAAVALVGGRYLELCPNLFSGISLNQLRWTNSNPIGTFVNHVRLLLGNPEWELPEWWQAKYKTKRKRPKGFGSIKRIGERIEGDRVAHAIAIVKQGKIANDNSPTGSGKSHDYLKKASAQWRKEHVNGRVIYCTKDVRNLTNAAEGYEILWARNAYGTKMENGKKVWADESTPLSEIVNIKGKCTRTEQFTILANKGIDPYTIGGEPLPCQSCPDKHKCRTTEGWFRKDRRDCLSSGNHLIAHPNSLLGVDLSEFPTLLIIDEFSAILTGHSNPKGNIDNLNREINDYVSSLSEDGINHYVGIGDTDDPDQLFAPARKISVALEKLGVSKEGLSRYGLDDQKIFSEALNTYSDGANQIINVIANLAPNLYSDFEQREVSNRVERLEWEDEIRAKLSARISPLLPYILRYVAGDPKVSPHVKGERLAATVFNPDRYKDFSTAGGIIITDATGDIERAKAYFPGREIAPFWKGEDNPQKNLSIHIVEVKGIAGRGERSKKFIKLYGQLIKGVEVKHGSKPIQFSLKCDRETFGVDGHWGADTRGSNDFAGKRLMVASGMPAPNMTAKRAEFLTMGGNPNDFDEWYQQEINREILQAVGRPRCHRYPDQHFDFYLIVPPGYDWEFLKWEGASVDFISPNELARLSGDDRESKIEAAIVTLTAQNIAPSVRAIAEITGIPKTIVARTIQNAPNQPPDCVLESTTGVSHTVPNLLNKLLKENGTPCDSETVAEKANQLGAAIAKLLAQKITPSLRTIAGEMGTSKDAVARLLKKTKPLDEWVSEIEAPPTAIGNADPPAMIIESVAEPRKNRAIIPGSVVELMFNGDRHLVSAINGDTVVSKSLDSGETALTHIDWVRLVA